MKPRRQNAFTLVEMIVVVAVVTALTGLVFAAVGAATRQAAAARETAAIRKLIAGYLMATAEDAGNLPAGYDKNAPAAAQRDGRVVSGEASHRYPWRMMPYLDGSVLEALYVSKNRRQVDLGNDYMVSLYPSFGMNQYFVGGQLDGESERAMSNDVAKRISQVSVPSKLLVFASSRADDGSDKKIEGYFKLTPPNLAATMWVAGEEFEEKTSADHYGHLDLRFQKRAVCAFLDGHVAQMDIKELKDMRYWSMRAAEANNPNYVITPPQAPGRPGRY